MGKKSKCGNLLWFSTSTNISNYIVKTFHIMLGADPAAFGA